jgi:phosphoribosylformylglycinamidine synthase
MAACGEPGEDAALYQTVRAIGEELCPQLGIAIPVGKDSLSMHTTWSENDVEKERHRTGVAHRIRLRAGRAMCAAHSLRSCAATAARRLFGSSTSRHGRHRLGASAFSTQVYDAARRRRAPISMTRTELSAVRQRPREPQGGRNFVLAYHDRSDGGLFATLAEMAFAGHCGLEISLPQLRGSAVEQLFAEELGAVIQVRVSDEAHVAALLASHGFSAHAFRIGAPVLGGADAMRIRISVGPVVFDELWIDLKRAWSETTWQMRRLRDEPACADEEYAACTRSADPGLSVALTFDPQEDVAAPYIARGLRPAIAILREEGVNSQVETAAAFERAGFEPHDVHMTDLLEGRRALADFKGLVACGGFSYGDVLGAGEGWAKSILFHGAVREEFMRFFARTDSFALGICNGCQMFAALKTLIPGTEHWPRFVRNLSEQYEARFSLVEIRPSPSVLLTGMAGSYLPVAVAHGEGHAEFDSAAAAEACARSGLISCRYVQHDLAVADTYPFNPSGSPFGLAALSNSDGRFTIIMPHPERSFRYAQNSWRPQDGGEYSGWMRLFRNARRFVD